MFVNKELSYKGIYNMNIKYNWKQNIDITIRQNIECKINEWIAQEDPFNNPQLNIELSFTDPLDTLLSGVIRDINNKIICNFTSNEFFDNMSADCFKEKKC